MASEILSIRTVKRKETGKPEQFFSSVLVLSLSAVIVKIIGLVYKIPMLRLLGSEGMGYFNCAYEIYALLCVISTSGLPVAMSVMISRNDKKRSPEQIFKSSMRLFLILGIAGTALMLVFSYPFACFLGSNKSFYCILAIAPTLLFICIMSAYRGYFQGLSRMVPTAISQIIEALGKLILGVLFASLAITSGFDTESVSAFAVLGLVLGSAVGAMYLFVVKRSMACSVSDREHDPRGTVRELLSIAVPVTLSAAVISFTKMIDMTMILRRLQKIGVSSTAAFSAYGSYTTLCIPLFGIAPALISSVALPLVPKLSRAISEKDDYAQEEAINNGLRLTSIISMPVSIGLALFSKEILSLIFKNETEAILLCAPLLSMLAFSITLSCLITVGNSILQAYGTASFPVISMGIGTVIKTVLAYFLIGNVTVNISGAPISTFFCDLVINLLNFGRICKHAPRKIDVKSSFIKPFAASVLAVTISKAIYGVLSARNGEGDLITVGCIGIAALLYAIFCIVFRVIEFKEIRNLLPKKSAKTIYNKKEE